MSSDTRPVDWEPLSDAVLSDPVEALGEMRRTCPVARSDWRGWSLFRYEDIVEVCKDPATFGNAEPWEDIPEEGKSIPLRLDPPEHGPYRRLLQDIFRPDRIRDFIPRAREIAATLFEPLLEKGESEFIAEFADPFPVQSVCAFLGWPAEDWVQIKAWFRQVYETRLVRDKAGFIANMQAWDAYIGKILEERRRSPKEDATSWLLAATIDGERVPDDRILSILRLLLQAGHGTTTASTGICTYFLATHPEAQAQLRAEPARIPLAIEEILRWDAPLVSMPRVATRDVEIGGRKIAAGDELSLMYCAANRDEKAFQNPDEVVLDRSPNRHLVFGSGIHTCVGAPFARQELRVALELLLSRTTNISLSANEPAVRQPFPRAEFKTLPVRFDRA